MSLLLLKIRAYAFSQKYELSMNQLVFCFFLLFLLLFFIMCVMQKMQRKPHFMRV